MTDVICPNCHSVTPPFKYCLDCNAELYGLDEILAAQPAAGSSGRSKRVATKGGGEGAVQMDAHLRRACRRTPHYGIHKFATSSTREDEVAVIAKVADVNRFSEAYGDKLRIVTVIEGESGEPTIVTARVRADETECEAVRSQPFVKSLKAARRIRPHLERLAEDIFGAGESSWPDRFNSGDGVIVGIIDFGLDLVHRNFRDRDGHTRILALWDQKAPAGPHSPAPFHYGRLFSKSDIDHALGQDDPHGALGYHLPKDGISGIGAHGTYVADVAAGNGLGSGAPGIARDAGIVFVDISTAGTPISSPHSVGNTFGDSAQLLEAIHFIFKFAKDRGKPCVINVSLGTNGGPHDGSSLVEEGIDRLVTSEPNRAVVIAAGNSFGKAIHVTGQVPGEGWVDLQWQIPPFESTGNELEIWYPGDDRLAIELIDPEGRAI